VYYFSFVCLISDIESSSLFYQDSHIVGTYVLRTSVSKSIHVSLRLFCNR
jgi:hypothetical protein